MRSTTTTTTTTTPSNPVRALGSQVSTQLRDHLALPAKAAKAAPQIGLEQYYSEAGPDYAAWSREFNMHFGYYRVGRNPLCREVMLEQMNAEVLARLRPEGIAE